MELPFYQVDAFTDEAFKGNPAAVVPLRSWLSPEVMLKMAQEHNQSETAFFIPATDGDHDFDLTWFTPVDEVDLCGHATLASACVIFNHMGYASNTIRFKTKSAGTLKVTRDGKWLELDFPVRKPERVTDTPDVLALLNIPGEPVEILRTARDWYIVYESADAIRQAAPDMHALAGHKIWQCITAPGDDCDFVSRFFTASGGMNEDPVTGSTHCALVPYWAERLGKTELTARQLSARGGFLRLTLAGDRVKIAGQARLYSKGHVFCPS